MNVIYTCGCGDTDAFVKDAFHIIFPKRSLPPIKQGSKECENSQVAALAKSNQKYAYYFGETETWDLLKGVRIA